MKKLLFLLFLQISFLASAQNPGDVAQNFGSSSGFNSYVRSIAVQADGKILVGGGFVSYRGTTENRIIRLNADGSKDTTFNTGTGFNGSVRTIAQQVDGKIIVGGEFTTYNGVTENFIIRLNTDGSKDATFTSGIGFNSTVNSIAQQADGKILVGGDFTTFNGVTENRIIRLNADGSKDTAFSTGTGFNGNVNAIETQADGKILVGGLFTTYNGGVTENDIIRLNADGSKDTAFSTGTGFNGNVNAIETQADGKILVGGLFTSYKGFTENRIVRLNADGSKDTAFSTGTGFNNEVFAITAQTDGKILVGGVFTSYNGVTENRIIRLDTDGTKDATLATGTGFNSILYSIEQQADGKILVGGNFTTYNGTTENFIIRLNTTDGSKNATFNTGTGFNTNVYIIEQQTDGKILLGGDFTTFKGTTENRIIRLNTDGTKDTSFNSGTGFNNSITSIEQQIDSKILVAGWFVSYNGVTENRIIRLNTDGTKDSSFNTGTGFNETARTTKQQVDGKILAGGVFTMYKGITENRIIRLNTDGSKDASFITGTGFNNIVRAIILQTDGKIIVGGDFNTYNGIAANRIIRLNNDGTIDTSFNVNTGFNGNVLTSQLQPDGKILVGGNFTTYNGATANRIVRLNTDGSLDTGFNTGTGFNSDVWAIELQTNSKIVIGGAFTLYKGVTENRIITLNIDGTKNINFISDTGFNNNVRAIAQLADGKILVGGLFTTYKGDNSSVFLIKLHQDQSLSTTTFDAANAFVIYPNPVQDVLHLQSNNFTTIKGVKIYDLQGKVVLQDTSDTINVSNLSKGLYIVKISTEEGEVTKKFIKE